MAARTRVRLIDDLDGSEASETVTFHLDGTQYEIDLSDEHVTELRGLLWTYINAGRRVGKTTPRQAATTSDTPRPDNSRKRNQDVRDWAAGQGITLSARGRIPRHVLTRYDNRNNPTRP